jgi:hypothetical protein
MRAIVAGLFVIALGSAWSHPAKAASACTAWVEFKGTDEQCMQMVARQTDRASLKGQRSERTYFFWFGPNVVTARCIAEKGIIVLAAYHTQNDRACPLSDRVKKAIEP